MYYGLINAAYGLVGVVCLTMQYGWKTGVGVFALVMLHKAWE